MCKIGCKGNIFFPFTQTFRHIFRHPFTRQNWLPHSDHDAMDETHVNVNVLNKVKTDGVTKKMRTFAAL